MLSLYANAGYRHDESEVWLCPENTTVALPQNSYEHSTLIFALAHTGLRWGEATALRIRDVETVRRRIKVHENAMSISGTIHVGTPTTHQAREVPYPAFLNPLFVDLMKNPAGAHAAVAICSSAVPSTTCAAPTLDAEGLCRPYVNRRLSIARSRG
jgi:integrase